MFYSRIPSLRRFSTVRKSVLIAATFLSPAFVVAQNSAPAPPNACPVQFVHFSPSAVSVRIRNTSGKKIIGLVFNAALADATEHWKWYHWDFDASRPIRDFGWSKSIKNGDAKTLAWNFADLDFDHGGGGAFVLTSALFEDGTSWEESKDTASCKYVWYNSHKKFLARPVLLPFRE
jgi:hypothetical protein